MRIRGFARLTRLRLVHFLAATPSYVMAGGMLGQADCPAAVEASASELLQREVEAKEISGTLVTADVEVQHTVIKPPALSGSGELSSLQYAHDAKVKVEPYKCLKSQALQSTTDSDGVAKIQQLNVASGKYTDIFTIPANWTDPPFQSINSCAISPVDSIIHCSLGIKSKGEFLVRVDKKRVAFVAKMPAWRHSATFDNTGNYWMYGDSGLSVIKDVASKPSYSSWSDLSGKPPSVKPMTLGGDLAVLETGETGTLLLSLYHQTLYVVKVTNGDAGQHWVLSGTSGLPPSAVIWGNAWAYNNSIFFSSDTGEGVYRLEDFSINKENGSASFVRMGPAQATNWNDGLSCVGQGIPWEPQVAPHDCGSGKAFFSTTTHLTEPTNPASKTYFHLLNVSTGTQELYYEVDKSWTDPPFNSINSCAINPLDNVVHCTMEIDGRGSFLVRVDKTRVAFVARVPAWTYAGAFDADGTYYMYGNDGLCAITNVTEMNAYSSYTQLGGRRMYKGPYIVADQGADMAVLKADLEGTGVQTYLLSAENSMLAVVRVSQVTEGHPPAEWKLEGKGLPPMAQTYGSAWNFQEKIYFAADDGEGVYELDTKSIELKKEGGSAQFHKAGNAQSTPWNDGFSCINDVSPFKT